MTCLELQKGDNYIEFTPLENDDDAYQTLPERVDATSAEYEVLRESSTKTTRHGSSYQSPAYPENDNNRYESLQQPGEDNPSYIKTTL